MPNTAAEAPRLDLSHRNRSATTLIQLLRAARGKEAMSGDIRLTRNLASDHNRRGRNVGVGHEPGGEEHLRIGMRRSLKQIRRSSNLHDLAAVHDCYTICDRFDASDVVRDVQHGNATLALQLQQQIKDLCPQLDISDHPTFPILAALYHPPGGVIRHDAVVWGYGKEADKMGVEIHQYTDVTGINVENGKVTGVETNRGTIHCDTVISCVAGWSTLVCDLVGVPLPLTTHILQACVTEPVKPLLDKIIVSGTLHIYISQSDRGEFVMGSEIEPYSGYSNTSTFRFIEDLAMHMIELLPMLGHAKILRQWTGYCDVSPDYSPIMGLTEVEGFIIDAGWGTYGFKASPIVGFTIADLIGTGKTPELIQPFRWARFYENDLVSERGAAAVSH